MRVNLPFNYLALDELISVWMIRRRRGVLKSEFFCELFALVAYEMTAVIRSQYRVESLFGEQVLQLLDDGVASSEAQFEHKLVLRVVIDYY